MSTPGARTSYPTGDDLIYLLQSAGLDQLTDESAYELLRGACDSYVAASIAAFERRTHWQPYIASAGDTVRFFTPSPAIGVHRHGLYGLSSNLRRGGGHVIDLTGGLLDTPTEVQTGVTYDATGVAQPGTIRVANVDYILSPENAPDRSHPYRQIEFGCLLQGGWRSVKITGAFGFTRTLGEDVWRGILAGAADQLRAEGALQITGGESEVSIGTLRVRFNREGILKQFDDWGMRFKETISDNMRRDMGFN